MSAAAIIDRINYLNDPRVMARDEGDTFVRVDPATMTGTVTLPGPGGQMVEAVIGFRYAVCDTCGGRGSHTNPSIDAGGADTSDWDYEDWENYQSGAYDVACYGCKGNRVVPEPAPRDDAERATLAELADYAEARALSRAEQRAEMMMGA